jgi:hypothetical protein
MTNLKDLLSAESLENLTTSQAVEGSVFRMHLGIEEGVRGKNPGDVGRNKYFVVLGHDTEGNAIGFVLVDTNINPNLPKKRQEAHYRILAKDNAFLDGVDRYVDCSDFKVISKRRFAELFGSEKAKGTIDDASLTAIKQITSSYEDASPKLLKRFGLK